MLGWMAFSALVCGVSALLGFGTVLSMSPVEQGLILLVMAISGIVLLGAFDAHESSTRRDKAEES